MGASSEKPALTGLPHALRPGLSLRVPAAWAGPSSRVSGPRAPSLARPVGDARLSPHRHRHRPIGPHSHSPGKNRAALCASSKGSCHSEELVTAFRSAWAEEAMSSLFRTPSRPPPLKCESGIILDVEDSKKHGRQHTCPRLPRGAYGLVGKAGGTPESSITRGSDHTLQGTGWPAAEALSRALSGSFGSEAQVSGRPEEERSRRAAGRALHAEGAAPASLRGCAELGAWAPRGRRGAQGRSREPGHWGAARPRRARGKSSCALRVRGRVPGFYPLLFDDSSRGVAWS